MCVPYWWCTKHAQLIMGTWPIYKKHFLQLILTKKTFHLIKYLLATFIFVLSFQSVLVSFWWCKEAVKQTVELPWSDEIMTLMWYYCIAWIENNMHCISFEIDQLNIHYCLWSWIYGIITTELKLLVRKSFFGTVLKVAWYDKCLLCSNCLIIYWYIAVVISLSLQTHRLMQALLSVSSIGIIGDTGATINNMSTTHSLLVRPFT